jgi:hypothetical protein
MPETDEKRWQGLAQSVRREVARRFPGWTGGNAHDPGITLMELFAFLADNLLSRSRPIGARERAAVAQRLASVAATLATSAVGSAARTGEGLLRVNYYFGQLLDVDDFTVEQDYVREKFRRHNRRLHGAGIVTGLGVSIDRRGGGARVVIAPGFALSPLGEEIDVRRRVSRPLPTKGKALFVLVRFAERPCRPAPALGSGAGSGAPSFTRVEETSEVSLAPAADAQAVSIARLTRTNAAWALDRRFEPARTASHRFAARSKG